jgi:hypothetical protein
MTVDVRFISAHVISVGTKADIGVWIILGALSVPSCRGIPFSRKDIGWKEFCDLTGYDTEF